LQEDGREYDPADVYGQWLDSAMDMPIASVRNRSMLRRSVRYMGQLYVGDDQLCGGASQRFVVPSPCSQAIYIALGLPFCTYTRKGVDLK